MLEDDFAELVDLPQTLQGETGWGTLNCMGVSRVLKSGEDAIRSSRVCRNTLWKSSISGKLPKRLSI